MAYRILIVDDRLVVRKQLTNLLELADSIQIVGEAVDGWDAIRQSTKLNPDIVLMDLEMPNMDGFEATRLIKAKLLARIVVVFSVYADERTKQKAMDSGADAFVTKGTDLNSLTSLFERLFPLRND